ncbi:MULTISPECIES: helix-turn-helix domain-containing protein [unclassified Oceanispirochaeta]|uniref:helix-turn-helix domain-containing protein n=1 Tax=unclassified Oceanispirochaeta TaxID=2635722 RepID=UPI001314EB5A|nr:MULTISPECIES: helix-turn-helix domain-containing protein [unclassified Oceanispirochaeta]MBF9017471.1 helix-turn-helix domain-containing protein [Oceanispirochaeta sp. M2]NPD74043.1 helix-turn-helix domain-containing protein [Oceanispirochaeta sp. M1]
MNQPEIGNKVIHLRELKGITQERLAELCEVSTRTIQRIENGEVNPRVFTLNNLSNCLEFNFNDDYRSTELIWIIVLHLSSMFCIVIIPLVIWSFKKTNSIKIDDHGKNVLNFQITMTILLISTAILSIFIIPALILFLDQYNLVFLFRYTIITLIPFLFLIGIGLICFFQGLINVLKIVKDKPYRYIPSIPFLK